VVTALVAGIFWPQLSRLVARPADRPVSKQLAGERQQAKKSPVLPAAQPVVAKKEQPAPVKKQPPVREEKKPLPVEKKKPAPVQKPLPPLVKPAGPVDPLTLARFIDAAIGRQLLQENVPASPRADDAEFLRRVFLDIVGVTPPAEKVAAFLDNRDPNKRSQVIDELLADPRFGRHMADIWQALLLPRSSDNKKLQPQPLRRWLEDSFNGNKPWSQVATELVTATGTRDQNGAVVFYIANPAPDRITDTVTRLFLGVQLQCAQCHNHPFTDWKQDEYWAMAAFFSKLRMTGNPKKAAKKRLNVGLHEGGKGKALPLPESARQVPAKFLQGPRANLDPNAPYRPALAQWMTAPGNPFFARAMVNRTWAQFFGRGFVNPVDDMHDKNTPSHPELLQVLADQFSGGGYNLKNLIRAICNSQTYQRTSKPYGSNETDEVLFSHVAIKVMSPQQLYDSLETIVGRPGKANRQRGKKANKKGQPRDPRTVFVLFFQTEEGADPTEYQAGIPQALRLMNSRFSNGNPLLNRVLSAPAQTSAQVIERLFLATLSRRPTTAESTRLTTYVQKEGGRPRQAYSDILWALLNSSEYTFNH
jgi:hypothetical protein